MRGSAASSIGWCRRNLPKLWKKSRCRKPKRLAGNLEHQGATCPPGEEQDSQNSVKNNGKKSVNAEKYSATELTFYLGPYTYKQRLLLRILRANSSFIRTGKPK